MGRIVVLKFGGTIVGADQRIEPTLDEAASLMDSHLSAGDFVVPVFSALRRAGGGSDPGFSITDTLLDYRNIILGRESLAAGEALFRESLAAPHREMIDALGLDGAGDLPAVIEALIDEAAQKAVHFAQAPVSPGHNDLLAHLGEIFSTTIIAAYLNLRNREGAFRLPVEPARGGDLGLVTDNAFSEAAILDKSMRLVPRAVSAFYARKVVPIVSGYNGVTSVREGDRKKRYITTLGRHGSDLTATYIAFALHKSMFQAVGRPTADPVWDDVRVYLVKETEGVLSADPKIVGDRAVRIPYLPYALAIEAGNVQARAIGPIRRAGMELRLFNPRNPDKVTIVGPRELREGLYLILEPAEAVYLQIETVPDYPGALSEFIQHFGRFGVNIAEVHHEHSNTALVLDDGLDHVGSLCGYLREKGYQVEASSAYLLRVIGNTSPEHMAPFNALIDQYRPLKYAIWERGSRALTCVIPRGGIDPAEVVGEIHDKFILPGIGPDGTVQGE